MTPQAVFALVGPTGSGKTAAAIEAARRLRGVVLSADSRQVYRGADALTGKEGEPGTYDLDGRGEMVPCRWSSRVPQLGIDLVEPGHRWTAFAWCSWADKTLGILASRGVPAVVCGGTGLYVEGLVRGYRFPSVFAPRPAVLVGIDLAREELRARIRTRIDSWFDAGTPQTEIRGRDLAQEVWTAMGYGEAYRLTRGWVTLQEAKAEAFSRTWAYARRQRTYFRNRLPETTWVTSGAAAVEAIVGPGSALAV